MGLGWWFTPYDAERDKAHNAQRRAERDREARRKRAEKEAAKRRREREKHAARAAPSRPARPAKAARPAPAPAAPKRRAVVVRPKAAPAAPARPPRRVVAKAARPAPAPAAPRRAVVTRPKAAPAPAAKPAKSSPAVLPRAPLMPLDTATTYARAMTKNAPGGTFTAAQMGHAVEHWHVQAHSIQGADNVDRAKDYAKAQTGAVLARLQAAQRIERSGSGFRAV